MTSRHTNRPTSRLGPYAICRVSIAFVWLYHGLVPKLLGPHEDELAMNMTLGLSQADAVRLAYFSGVIELAIGAGILLLWRQRWPLTFAALAMIGLLLFSIVALPSLSLGAFNPVTTNSSVLALTIVAHQMYPYLQEKPASKLTRREPRQNH
jgi:hypothetical protein